MTGTEDSNSSTRPISVAELLARNGTIGAPPVGGRRRRRRGNADAVTVAELTGEIPIIRPDDPPPTAPVAEPTPAAETPSEPDDEPSTNGVVDHTDTAAQDDVQAEPEAEPDAVDDVADAEPEEEAEQAESAESDPEVPADPEAAEDEADTVEAEAVAEIPEPAEVPEPVTAAEPVVEQSSPPPAPKRRFGFPRFGRKSAPVAEPAVARAAAPAQAEVTDVVPTVDEARDQTALDDAPADIEVEDIDVEAAVDTDTATADAADTDIADYIDDIDDDDLAEDLDKDDLSKDDDSDKDDEDDEDDLPSYLRPSKEPRLFGGPSAADRELVDTIEDDLADEDLAEDDLDDDLDVEDEPRKMSSVVHAAWIVGQCVIAVFFGAGLFVAFDQLWKWNNIIALVLSVLVILGLVVGVRIVRKTEDIGSTLIAVAVGALVTLGPLALLQSG